MYIYKTQVQLILKEKYAVQKRHTYVLKNEKKNYVFHTKIHKTIITRNKGEKSQNIFILLILISKT